jgi:transcriptional regulatory protein LevR
VIAFIVPTLPRREQHQSKGAPQIQKIKELEELLGWKDSPERLEGFIVRQTGHKSKKEWLSVTDAQKVIEGMKRMVGRKSP